MSITDTFEVSEEYELKLLANLIDDEIFLTQIIEILKEEYFSSAEHQWVFAFIKKYHMKYSSMATKDAFIIEIKNQGLKKSVRDPILIILHKIFEFKRKYTRDSDIIKEDSLIFCRNQAVSNALVKSAELLPYKKFSEIRHVLDTALMAGEIQSGGIDFDNIDDRRINKPRKHLIPLPWNAINTRIGGGMAEGEFMVLVAPMGAGKTMIASIIAKYMREHGHDCLFASLELDARKIRHRIDAMILNEPLSMVKEAEEYADIIHEKILSYPKSSLVIEKFSPTGTTTATLRTKIKMLKSKGIEIKYMLVDYLDILDTIDPAHNNKKDWEKQEFVSRDLFGLASELNIRIVGLVQGNTTASDAEVISVKTTSGGTKRLHPADLILGYARPDNFKIQNKANISFIKNRFGKDGYVLSATTNYDYGVINIEDTELSPDIETKEVVEESLKDKYQNFVKKRKMSESSEAFSDLI